CAQIRGCQSRAAAVARTRRLFTSNAGPGVPLRVPRYDAWPARCALARERGASAAHRRHDELVAAAGARLELRASTEARVRAEANASLAQAPAAAGHRDAVAAEAGIGLHERLLDRIGRDRERRARRDIAIGDLHRRARLAHGLEIGVRAQPRAGSV